MSIAFTCKCGQKLEAEDEQAGLRAKCPKCGESMTIPSAERKESKCPECGKPTKLNSAFLHTQYLFRRKVFTLLGRAFQVYDETGNLVLYSRQKPFRLREDFRVYSDETQSKELLIIRTPQILDIGATYGVQDATTRKAVGAIRRMWLKSMLKDEWTLISHEGREIGKLTESSLAGALLSRFINLVPQQYVIVANGKQVAEIKQHFNPFILRYTMTITEEAPLIDRRLLIAAGILLAGIERRQKRSF